jgi:hypothetical protein
MAAQAASEIKAMTMVPLTAAETLDGASLLPGFTCPVADLFG